MATNHRRENMKTNKKSLGIIGMGIAAMFAVLLAGSVMAADYPEKPIKIYFGYKAGGACHTSLQPLAMSMEKSLGQPVILVEKPGAGATLAGGMVSKAKPDGYTLGVIKSTTITTAPHELKLPYSPADDLIHLYAYAGPASGFAVKADAPWQTWQEFIAYAKANPGKVAWTATGATGTQYLLMQHIGKQEGIDWNGVPSESGGAAMKLVLGGQVAGYAASGSHVPQVKSGNARALVDFGEKSIFPGVPTLEDLGYKGLAIQAEPYIFVAPKGLPADIQGKLVHAIEQATKSPEFAELVEKLEMQVVNVQGEELEAMLVRGSNLVTMLLKSAGKIE